MATKSEINHKIIGQKIKEARETIGFTQQELGEKIDKTGAAIGYIERGERGLNVNDLIAFSKALNVPLKFFFQDKTSETILLQETLYKLHTNIDELNQTIKTQQANINSLTRSLPRSEELRLITQSSIDPILLIQKDGVILFCTKSIFHYTGVYHSLLKNKNFFDFVDPSEKKSFTRFIRQVFKQKKVHDFKTKLIKNKNKTIDVEINAQLINKNGQLVIHLILRDISYRKKIQAKLSEKESIYRHFIEQANQGFFIINSDGKIILWNKNMSLMTKIKKDQALNKKIWDLSNELNFGDLSKTQLKTNFEPSTKTRAKKQTFFISDIPLQLEIKSLNKTLNLKTFVLNHLEENLIGCVVNEAA